jgi:beta-lactamase superfamily II metal-dependent hydrolase
MAYEVDFLPVGDGGRSGDAIAVRFGNLNDPRQQYVVVIDGGFSDTGTELVKHIKTYYKTTRVDLVISTHPDADHAAGLAVVLQEFRVGHLLMHRPWEHTQDIARMFRDGRVTDEGVEEKLRKALDNARELEKIATYRGIPIIEPFTGLTAFDGQLLIAGPSEKYYESLLPGFRCTPEPKLASPFDMFLKALEAVKETARNVAESFDIETLRDDGDPTSAENNSSVITLIRPNGDDRALLFTGDAGIPALTEAADYLDAMGIGANAATFIQVAHHGSRRNVGPTILNRLVGPKLRQEAALKTAFVSASKDGAPKHPARKVTNAFRRRGAPVHATQGIVKWHHSADAPARADYTTATPLPLFTEVDE